MCRFSIGPIDGEFQPIAMTEALQPDLEPLRSVHTKSFPELLAQLV